MGTFVRFPLQTCPALGLLAIASVLCSICPLSQAEEHALIKVDHVYVLTQDEAARKALFGLFTETLQLPIAAPEEAWTGGPAGQKQGVRGTISLGSVQLELTSIQGRTNEYFNTGDYERDDFSISGLILTPEIPYQQALALLESIGLMPVPMPNYDVAAIAELSGEPLSIYLMSQNDAWVSDSERLDSQFQQSNGGLLGLVGVKEVIVATPPDKKGNPFWRKMADCDNNFRCEMADGRSIVLKDSQEYGVQGLVLEVRSLKNARDVLKSHDLLGNVTEASVTFNPDKLNGLNLKLVEQ